MNLMSNWKTVSCEAPQKSKLESLVVNIFISNLYNRMQSMIYIDFSWH